MFVFCQADNFLNPNVKISKPNIVCLSPIEAPFIKYKYTFMKQVVYGEETNKVLCQTDGIQNGHEPRTVKIMFSKPNNEVVE